MSPLFFLPRKSFGAGMVALKTFDGLNNAENWIQNNQSVLIHELFNIVVALVILLVGYIISRIVDNILSHTMKRYGTDTTVADFVSTLAHHLLLATTIIIVLSRVGIKTTSILAVLSAAGLAIGLALQGSLTHLASGVLLVTFRPFRTGEYIEIGSVSGTVDKVHVFSTTLRSSDNKIIVVPNGKAISSNIVNYSREPLRRVDITLNVACDSDIDEVKSAIMDCISSDNRILHTKEISVRLREMDITAMKFIIRVWTTTQQYWEVYFDLLENTKRELDSCGIRFPSAALNIHLGSEGIKNTQMSKSDHDATIIPVAQAIREVGSGSEKDNRLSQSHPPPQSKNNFQIKIKPVWLKSHLYKELNK